VVPLATVRATAAALKILAYLLGRDEVLYTLQNGFAFGQAQPQGLHRQLVPFHLHHIVPLFGTLIANVNHQLWVYGRSPQTERAYRADAQRFMEWANKPLGAVTLPNLVDFSKTLSGLAPASPLRILSSVKSLFAFGHRIGYLPYDVGRALRLPVVRDQLVHRILPEANVHRILSLEEDPRNRALLTLLYASGVRVRELCGLRWQDVSATADGGQVTVLGKGSKTRSIRLPQSVWIC
jgi:site-specific recombinase XerD